MTPALELTSIPTWATAPVRPPADLSGRTWTIVSFETSDAADTVAEWIGQLAGRNADAGASEATGNGPAVTVHRVRDDAEARAAIEADAASALVGWRLMLNGPADACLRARAVAVGLGVGDDELVVATVDVGTRDVHCAHCRAVTRADVELEHVVPCSGCGRNLFVYYHVSRRLGAHLGFMVDAETSGPATS